MKNHTTSRYLYSALLAAALLVPSAYAQTSATPAAAQQEETNDDVLTLPEFTFKDSKSNNYAASESITGTRVATKIRDLPFAVNAVTSEFIKDLAAYEFTEQVSYVSSVSPNENQGQYQIRGFLSEVQLVDGFRRLGLIDSNSIDRLEVIKGPAASVYGRVSPGGVVNIITNKPKPKPEQNITTTYGSMQLYRLSAYSTGPVGKDKKSNKLFYRADFAMSGRHYQQAFSSDQTAYGALVFSYKINADTSASFGADYAYRHEIHRASLPIYREYVQDPYKSTGTTYLSYTSLAKEFYKFNYMGPSAFRNRQAVTVHADFEHRYNDVWSTKAGVSWSDRAYKRLWVSGGFLNKDTGLFNQQTPEWDDQPTHTRSAQIDNLFKFNTGSVKHTVLLTVDYNAQTDRVNKLRMGTTPAADLALNPIGSLKPTDPNYTFVTFQQDRTLYTNNTQNDQQSNETVGVFASYRLSLLKDRLNILLGGRYDYTENTLCDYHYDLSQTGVGPYIHAEDVVWHPTAFTHQAGISYRVLSPLTLFASHSSSFDPQAQVAANTNEPLPNESGTGWEMGFKVVAFDERVSISVSYYDVTRKNILANFTNADTGAKETVLSGKENAKGYETDFNIRATDSLQIFGGYGHLKARILESEAVPYSVGTSPRRVPDDTIALGIRYEFKAGSLKGMYFTIDEKYNGSSVSNDLGSGRRISPSSLSPIINNPMPNGVLPYPELPAGTYVYSGRTVRVNDGRENIRNGAWATLGGSVGYRWKAQGLKHKVQVNVKNILNRQYTSMSGIPADPLTFTGTYAVTF